MKPSHYKFVEHTADIQLAVVAPNLEELFSMAAQGMSEYIFGTETFDKIDLRPGEIRINSDDYESLLVDWLSRLIFLISTKNERYFDFKFNLLSSTELRATLSGVQATPIADIKAVTYHGLKITESESAFQATITFDI